MSQGNRKPMDSSKPGSFFPRSTSTVSLNKRFSQVLVDQLTRPRMRTLDPILLQQRRWSGTPQVVLLLKRKGSLPLHLQTRGSSVGVNQRLRRRSVWTRLGWQQGARRLSTSRSRGFWSFVNKYRWRSSFTSTYRGRTHLQRGGATRSRRRGQSKDLIPTKKQLDAQLDEYMSMSKRRLDKQLDEYMSMSKRRLDAQLDEYMSMAGQTYWDGV